MLAWSSVTRTTGTTMAAATRVSFFHSGAVLRWTGSAGPYGDSSDSTRAMVAPVTAGRPPQARPVSGALAGVHALEDLEVEDDEAPELQHLAVHPAAVLLGDLHDDLPHSGMNRQPCAAAELVHERRLDHALHPRAGQTHLHVRHEQVAPLVVRVASARSGTTG